MARGVCVMVIDGKKGHGVSCKVTGKDREDALQVHRLIAALLRRVADEMDAEYGPIGEPKAEA